MPHASERKILIVDDEPDVRNFLAACIEDAGFQVDTAADGEEALEKLKLDPPDLMTLDMVMPRKSGINLMRQLRSMERFAHLPVIVITAHAHDELGSEDFKGFNAFASGLRPRVTLEKPVTPKKLVDAISTILGVETDAPPLSQREDERFQIMEMIGRTDPANLQKIRELLNSKR
ncbi:MAG: response regulator [Desulfobacteraceae bacterium]|nr:MAG: response regulator [Desulfobacteraceae bacterium]